MAAIKIQLLVIRQVCTVILLIIFVYSTFTYKTSGQSQTSLGTISTDTTNYRYLLATDAKYISYTLIDSQQKVLSRQEHAQLSDADSNRKSINLQLAHTGNYRLEFRLEDEVSNLSDLYIQHFVKNVPATSEYDSGNIYGADANSPWGRNNNFANYAVSMDLIIYKDLEHETYAFENVYVPTPMLTFIERTPITTKIYGQAVSKKTLLYVDIYKIYPSFAEAEKFCKGRLKAWEKLSKSKLNKCIMKILELNNLDKYLAERQGICVKNSIFINHNCVNRIIDFKERRYIKSISTNISHTQVVFIENSSTVHTLWQEQDTKAFAALNTAQKPQGLVYTAESKIFGEISFAEKSYSYHGFKSKASNRIKSQVNQSQTQTQCGSKACKLLNIEYFNQAVDKKGKWETWKGWPQLSGAKACGAASAVMVSDYFLNFNKVNHSLKSYVFQDNNKTLKEKKCSRPGAFAVTAADKKCNQSSLGSINNYLQQQGLRHEIYWPTGKSVAEINTFIKTAIAKNHPVILSYKKPIGHILVVKGYTYNNQLIVNDPYRDVQNNYLKGKYDYSGKDAIYSTLPNSKYKLNYLIEVYK